MNKWPVIIFFIVLAISVLSIVITLISLPKLGDERSNFIKLKAQSYTFTIVVGMTLLDVIQSIYVTFKTAKDYTPTHPIILLTVISFAYLIALLFAKKKYGG